MKAPGGILRPFFLFFFCYRFYVSGSGPEYLPELLSITPFLVIFVLLLIQPLLVISSFELVRMVSYNLIVPFLIKSLLFLTQTSQHRKAFHDDLILPICSKSHDLKRIT